jgi:CheY-like chemotaxis protein
MDPTAGNARAMRILLVEDHAQTRQWLQVSLEGRGYVVQSAKRFEEALTLLGDGGWDLLLSDIGLPDGSGWDLLMMSAVKPRFAIAMSGYGAELDHARSKAAGFRAHLVKPFTKKQLEVALDEAVLALAAADGFTGSPS